MTLILIHENEWSFRYYGRVVTVTAPTYSKAVSKVTKELRRQH